LVWVGEQAATSAQPPVSGTPALTPAPAPDHVREPLSYQFRMGLNSGLVVGSIGNNLRMDYSAIGDTTNLAARLQQVAASGTILMSEATSRLAQGYIRVEALPPVEVRGKTEPVPLYKVIGTLPRRSPIASRSERTLKSIRGQRT
jgi:class 3 adenylate cyclase